MRYEVISGGIGISYPDAVVFAFMPNIVSVTNAGAANAVDIRLTWTDWQHGQKIYTKSISVPIVGGAASVDISHILQSFFGDMSKGWVTEMREKQSIIANIKIGNTTFETMFDNCLWGALDPMGRIGDIGTMPYNAELKEYQRTIRWFKNFPFSIEVFFGKSGQTVVYSNDGGDLQDWTFYDTYWLFELLNDVEYYDDPLRDSLTGQYFSDIIIKPWNEENVWDATFDYTFAAYDMSVQQHIRVNMDYRTEGHYLRWIDINGIICYYLFAEGSDSIKTSDNGTMAQAITGGGMQYNDGARVYGKTRERSMKICATLVPDDEQKLVQSIGSAVLCDLYVGKDANSNELWLPVVPKAGTLSIRENQGLQDIEVEIQLPSGQIQRL